MIEICCGSYEDAMNAYKNHAKRVELNSALHLGGLTPSIASLKLLKEETDLEVICMVRVRGAGFCYSELEYKQMKQELYDLLKNGADGIAFGFLNNDCTINKERTKEFIEIIHSYHKTAVFHRAFDCTRQCDESIQLLIELGVDRILTSGLEPTAIQGKGIIKHLQDTYGSQIEILPGSGINASNAKEFIEYTGVTQIHSSCRDFSSDPTTSSYNVTYAFLQKPHQNDYDYVSGELVKNLVYEINE